MKAVGIIPARYASTRLPGKPLLMIAGRTMIEHVHDRAQQASSLDEVYVATDDERVMEVVASFGGKGVMTDSNHPCGTDRIAEVARDLEADVIVNIQGDEPLLEPLEIDAVVEPFRFRQDLEMATLGSPLTDSEAIDNPANVKVVIDQEGYALYFSRAPIPFYRGQGQRTATLHVGLYAYTRDFLLCFARMAPSPLEQAEQLEQLRALEAGHRILVVPTEHESVGVDTQEDLELVRRLVAGRWVRTNE